MRYLQIVFEWLHRWVYVCPMESANFSMILYLISNIWLYPNILKYNKQRWTLCKKSQHLMMFHDFVFFLDWRIIIVDLSRTSAWWTNRWLCLQAISFLWDIEAKVGFHLNILMSRHYKFFPTPCILERIGLGSGLDLKIWCRKIVCYHICFTEQ